jgi:hypothetical protein
MQECMQMTKHMCSIPLSSLHLPGESYGIVKLGNGRMCPRLCGRFVFLLSACQVFHIEKWNGRMRR